MFSTILCSQRVWNPAPPNLNPSPVVEISHDAYGNLMRIISTSKPINVGFEFAFPQCELPHRKKDVPNL